MPVRVWHAPKKAGPSWTPATLKIIDAIDGKPHEVSGERFGDLFVHDDINAGTGKHVVTHWHSTRLMSSTDSREDSKQMAEVAWAGFADELRKKDGLSMQLPNWFKEWCRRCRTAGKYLSIAEFAK